MTVKLGVTLPQFTDDPDRVVEAAVRAEGAGLDSIWLFDHLWPLSGGKERPILEQWSTLAYLARTTTRITIGTLVTRSTMRHPAVLAKMVATVGEVAPGRLIVTVGSGDSLNRAENDAFGLPYYAGDERTAQLASTVSMLRAFLSGERVSILDDFMALEDLPPSPRPSERPPVWLAGNGRTSVEAAAAHADGWNAWGKDAAWLRERARWLEGTGTTVTWGGIGRLEAEGSGASTSGTASPERHVSGPPERFAESLRGLAQAGAEHLVVTLPKATPETFEALATEVRPLL